MPLTPFPVEQFGGLDLAIDPTELGMSGAVDLLNVDTTRNPGSLVTRGGMSRLGTGTASYHRIAGFDSVTLAAFRNTGSVAAAQAVDIPTGTFSSAYTWGGSSTRVTSTVTSGVSAGKMYIASRSGASNETTQQMLTSGAGTTTIFGGARYLARSLTDQRLVLAHFTSAGATPSGANGDVTTVFFSDPGAAGSETFPSTNWVKLLPGDGEEITGVVSWGTYVFVAKRSKLFVFYGTSVQSDGTPVFQYRTVDLPSRTRVTVNGGGENMIAGADGVYLLLGDGLYRTTGGPPVRVSDAVTPIFDSTGPTTILIPSFGDWTISYAANRVYLNYLTAISSRALVYDTRTQTWLLWDLSIGSASQPTNVIEWVNSVGTPVPYIAVAARIYSFFPTATTDDGTAIAWSYTTGYSSAGGYFRQRIISSGERKKHFKTDILGSGTVTHQVLALNARPNDVADTGGSVTLGTSPAIARGSRRRGVRGTYFAHKLSGSGPAVVSGLTYWLSEISLDT